MKLFKIGLICLLFGVSCDPVSTDDRLIIINHSQKEFYMFFDIYRHDGETPFILAKETLDSRYAITVPKDTIIRCNSGTFDWYAHFPMDSTPSPIYFLDKAVVDSLSGTEVKPLSQLPSYGILARHDITIDSLEHKMNWTIVYP